MTSNNALDRTVNRWGCTVLALNCALAGAESTSRSAGQLDR